MKLYYDKEWLTHQHQVLKKPIRQIAEEVGATPRAVRHFKEKHGIETPREVRYSGVTRYKVNTDYFDLIDTEEKAYWLGFIVADGCIASEECFSKRLSFTVAEKDKEHLELFRDHVGSDAPVTTHITSIKGYSSYVNAKLRINSTELCDSLIRAGVFQQKSMIETYPNNIPAHLEKHFWRGLIDGDGCISIYETKGKKVIQLALVGSPEITERFHQFLSEQMTFRAKPYPAGSITRLTVSGKNAIKACNILYKDSTISLKRKYQLYQKGLELFSEDIV